MNQTIFLNEQFKTTNGIKNLKPSLIHDRGIFSLVIQAFNIGLDIWV